MAYINGVRLTEEFIWEVARGNIPGYSIVNKFGHGVVGTTLVPVTATLTWQTPTVDTALELVTTDAADNASGAGARLVEVQGYVKATGALTAVNVVPTGLTPIALTTDFFRLRRIKVIESGSYANATTPSHTGDIIVQGVGSGPIWGKIGNESGFGLGQSQIGVDMIPGGKTGYVVDGYIDIESSKVVAAYLFQRQNANDTTIPYDSIRIIKEAHATGGTTTFKSEIPFGPYPEFTDIGVMAKVATGTAGVAVTFQLLLVDN